MVKNAGGNKSKRQGRKFVTQPPKRNLRLIQEDGELYAAVIKLYGGANCEVICMDGVIRLCVIRNKFRGRHKRDNQIEAGTWVLVGLRDWEARAANKQPRCDMLEVYNAIEKDRLRVTVKENLSVIISAFEDECSKKESDAVEFVDEDAPTCATTTMNDTGVDGGDDDEFDIDIDEI
jgi:translation initiation factor 1A